MNQPTLHTFARHADVAQALGDPALVPPGQRTADPAPTRALRTAVAEALAPALLQAWQLRFEAAAQARLDACAEAAAGGRPVDWRARLAEPWALDVARVVTGLGAEQAQPARQLAAELYQVAAESAGAGTGVAASAAAARAATELQRLLAAPEPDAATARWADVQTFVALTQSLPDLLANAWRALIEQPGVLAGLLAEPARLGLALDELLRLGSPARAVFREAAIDTHVGTTPVAAGSAVTLLLWEANRDPERFDHPETLDLDRPLAGHLGLGGGLHGCPGARLVRLALQVITQALLQRTAQVSWTDTGPPAWRGGFALRSVSELPVHWQPAPRRAPAG